MDESNLRAHIRELLSDGRLPAFHPTSVLAGPGNGLACDCCGDPLERDDVEYDVSIPPEDRALRMHCGCYRQWQAECYWRSSGSSTRIAQSS